MKKILIIIVNLLVNNYFCLFLLGLFNKFILNKRFNSIFIMYPASEKYSQRYVFDWYADKIKWKPSLVGLLKQNGYWSFVFGITAMEADFNDDKNIKNLISLENKAEKIRKLLHLESKKFAGVLPSIFFSKSIIKTSSESSATVYAVIQAVHKLIDDLKLEKNVPIVLLGGMGFIGKKILEEMRGYEGEICSIDFKGSQMLGSWPEHLRGKNVIVLNVTKKGALNQYIESFWKEVVVLNEVYPEPSESEIERIKKIGSRCFHIVGVEGKSWPPFPAAYFGGIPCCASYIPKNKKEIKVIIKEL